MLEFIYFILVGIAAGFLAGYIMKGRGFGWLVNMLVGIAGAIIGGWLLGALGINFSEGIIGSLVTALIGAIVLLFIISLVKRK
jgi:uncharacterized membrane protein YeaQ/YmgE (transglycosylase-associated protein family)